MSYTENSKRKDRIERGIFYAAIIILYLTFLLNAPICQDQQLQTINYNNSKTFNSKTQKNNISPSKESSCVGNRGIGNEPNNLKNLFGVIPYMDRHEGFFVGFFTFCLFVSTMLLWKAGEKQTKLTKDSLIADKRAFVYAAGITPYWEKNQTTDQYEWRFRPIWRNSGETPTKNMVMYTECNLLDARLPAGFNFDYPVTETGTGLIPPQTQLEGGQAPRLPQRGITTSDITEVQAGRKFLYIWGWIKYFDVFPESVQHITRFCWAIIPHGDPTHFDPNVVGSPPSPGVLVFRTIHHFEGNCADDECTNY